MFAIFVLGVNNEWLIWGTHEATKSANMVQELEYLVNSLGWNAQIFTKK